MIINSSLLNKNDYFGADKIANRRQSTRGKSKELRTYDLSFEDFQAEFSTCAYDKDAHAVEWETAAGTQLVIDHDYHWTAAVNAQLHSSYENFLRFYIVAPRG